MGNGAIGEASSHRVHPRLYAPIRRFSLTSSLPFAAGVVTSAAIPEISNEGRPPMARQFIYHMQGLTKTYPGNRKVLDDIYLQFYPDAKIGVLGVNGSGKSTLLRIMAGIDKEYNGEAWIADGARVGYLEQEPQLDPS